MRGSIPFRFGLLLTLISLSYFHPSLYAADTTPPAPVPDAVAQAKAEKLIAEIYQPYPPTKPADQKSLFTKFLDQAKEANADPATQFVLLREAARLAAISGDLDNALLAINALAKAYQVDADALRSDAVRKIAPAVAVPASALRLTMPLLQLSNRAMKSGNYTLSLEAANAADKACRTANDLPMATLTKEQVTEAGQVLAAFQSAKTSFEKLATAPDDAASNLTAGKFLCFARNQWEIGLPMLVKGSDDALKALAQLDKTATADAAAQRKSADAWWQFSQSQTGINKRGLMRRAAYWYEKIAPGLSGLERPLAQKRINEAAATGRLGMQRVVDLVQSIDPGRDAVSGTWTLEQSTLTSNATSARVQCQYEPPAEYDFRIEFTRLNGSGCITQILCNSGASFLWVLFSGDSSFSGFDLIDGKGFAENPTAVRGKSPREINNVRYTSFVQVRKDVIRAYVNGKQFAEWKTDFKDMSIQDAWTMRDPKSIGVGSWNAPTAFHSIVVIEISDPGKLTH